MSWFRIAVDFPGWRWFPEVDALFGDSFTQTGAVCPAVLTRAARSHWSSLLAVSLLLRDPKALGLEYDKAVLAFPFR